MTKLDDKAELLERGTFEKATGPFLSVISMVRANEQMETHLYAMERVCAMRLDTARRADQHAAETVAAPVKRWFTIR